MKLTPTKNVREYGFALPTVLLISTVMIAILVTAIAAAAASRVALDSQYYNRLAQQAIESGKARASECLSQSGHTPQWSTKSVNRDLRPHTDCTGAVAFSNPYVVGTASGSPPSKVRTTYSIEAPGGSGIGSSLKVVGRTELVRTSSPHAVWRTYEQVGYLQIEPQEAVACPDGFISVPGNSAFGTSDFCVGKYEAKNVGGRAGSQAAGAPYTNISQTDAIAAAQNGCDGCRLITEAEWLTIAHNVVNVASNWSGGSVGNGYVYGGHSDNSPARVLEASPDDNNGYFDTGATSGDQRRTLRLSNGEVIWDFAGNAWEWTSGQRSGGQPGAGGLYAWRNWNTVEGTGSVSPNPFPSFNTPAAAGWTTTHGIGSLYSNSTDGSLRAYRRGGGRGNGNLTGIFTLSFGSTPSSSGSDIGFRLSRDN